MERRTFIKTLVLSSGALILDSRNLIASALDSKTIKMVMIFNNLGNHGNFISRWGLSIWIEDKDDAVLFDTGNDSSILWKNLNSAGIDLSKLSQIVISHYHWDHYGGLPIILEKTDHKPDVFVPMSDLENIRSLNPKARLKGVEGPTRINQKIWSTGQMDGTSRSGMIDEQSLLILQGSSILLLTGCSHPGIVEIVEKARDMHPGKKLELIIGGFHLLEHSDEQVNEISAKLKSLQVKKIAPSHCTGEEAIKIFKAQWKENFIDFNLGNSMKI